MKYGNINNPKEINNLWEVVYDSGELGVNTASLTISNLDGDADAEYKLIARTIHNNASIVYMKFNNDSGTNYGHQVLIGENTTTQASRATSDTSIEVTQGNGSTGALSYSSLIISAKSGQERLVSCLEMTQTSSSLISKIKLTSSVWSNTADNLTSITLYGSVGNDMDVGSRYILLRRVNIISGIKTGIIEPQGIIDKAWQKIYENELSSATTSVDITNLTGNSDVLYRLIFRGINGYSGIANMRLRINNDSGSNYYSQWIRGINSSAGCGRDSSTQIPLIMTSPTASGQLVLVDALIYAKAGFIRPVLIKASTGIASTTVNATEAHGQIWSNTADEITSLSIFSSQTNGLGIGTHIELWKLSL